MNSILKIVKYELHDVIRSKWLILYMVFFLVVTDGLFRFGGDSSGVIVSLMNVVLFIIPLVSVIFGTLYVYNAREFTELLLSQPINRRSLYGGLYIGLVIPLSIGFVLGVSIPFLINGFQTDAHVPLFFTLLASGVLLTFIFTALAFLISMMNEEKVRGFGAAIVLWLFFAIVYDGILLFITYTFNDYPLEKPIVIFTMLNSIDLARVLMMLQLDVAALMGYTGATFQNFFGSGGGKLVSFASLALWILIPVFWGYKLFLKKDF
jgi:Cu-processing system permease protein